MKLLVVSGSPLEQCGSEYYAFDTWLRFAQHLAVELEQVTVWSPITVKGDHDQPPPGAWRVEPGPLQIAPHEYFNSFASYFRGGMARRRRLQRELAGLIERHDMVVIRAPSPMLGLVFRESRRRHVPCVLMILGNVATQARGLTAYSGPRRLVYKAIVNQFVLQEVRCGRAARSVYAYSEEIARRHRHAGTIVTVMQDPLITASDIVPRDDTCLQDQLRIVRVCWLLPSKGLEPLIDAVALLAESGLNVHLEIVGKERTAGYRTSLERRATDRGIAGRVAFSGWVPVDRIVDVYLRSDVQVISSLAEGTPRCIVEGFARGLPLVCTNVGGCADVLRDGENALLVPPNNPAAIMKAVLQVRNNTALRQRIVRGGYEMARSATFETLGAWFLNELRSAASVATRSPQFQAIEGRR